MRGYFSPTLLVPDTVAGVMGRGGHLCQGTASHCGGGCDLGADLWWQYCEVSRQGTQSHIICYGAFIFTQPGTTSGMTLSTYRACSTLPLTHYLGITYIHFPLSSHRQSHPWSHSWSPLSCWTITRTGDLRVG